VLNRLDVRLAQLRKIFKLHKSRWQHWRQRLSKSEGSVMPSWNNAKWVYIFFHRLQLYLLSLAVLKWREFLVAASETSCRNFNPQCSWQFLIFFFIWFHFYMDCIAAKLLHISLSSRSSFFTVFFRVLPYFWHYPNMM